VSEARSEETPYGRHITSEGWFVLNLADSLAVSPLAARFGRDALTKR
jgi:hypothetical protein